MEWNSLTKKQKILTLIIGAIVMIILGAFLYFKKDDENNHNVIQTSEASDIEQHTAVRSSNYFVELTGYVNYPGVYELDHDVMLLELIEIAGGLAKGANTKTLHQDLPLSQPLKANQKIYIPGLTDSNSNKISAVSSSKVSINNAPLAELMTLDQVGEVTAGKIIANRPYSTLEDLKKVPGIGDATYNKIVTKITL